MALMADLLGEHFIVHVMPDFGHESDRHVVIQRKCNSHITTLTVDAS